MCLSVYRLVTTGVNEVSRAIPEDQITCRPFLLMVVDSAVPPTI